MFCCTGAKDLKNRKSMALVKFILTFDRKVRSFSFLSFQNLEDCQHTGKAEFMKFGLFFIC